MPRRTSTRRTLFLRGADRQPVARAETRWIFVDLASGRPLAIPAEARATPEQLSLWLRDHQQLDAQVIRKGGPGGGDGKPAPKWTLSGGTAGTSWALEYAPGSPHATLKRSEHSPLAAVNRLHKAVGGGTVEGGG